MSVMQLLYSSDFIFFYKYCDIINEIKSADTTMYVETNTEYRNQMKPDMLLSLIIVILHVIRVRRNIK